MKKKIKPGKEHLFETVYFRNNLEFNGEPACTIDLTEFMVGEPVIITPICFHIFHPVCFIEWLKAGIKERKCPNCNNSLKKYMN